MNIQTSLQSVLIVGVIHLGIVAQVNAQEWTLTPQSYVGFEVKSMCFSTI